MASSGMVRLLPPDPEPSTDLTAVQPKIHSLPQSFVDLLIKLVRRGVVLDGELIAMFESVQTDFFAILAAKDKLIKELSDKHGDAVTLLPNRAVCDLRLLTALQGRRRSYGGFAFMFIDMFEFKPINDTHGHNVGDMVLRTVAEILKTKMREYDFAGRWGGDEIIGLFFNLSSAAEAVELVTRVARAVRDYPWSTRHPAFAKKSPTVDIGMVYCMPDVEEGTFTWSPGQLVAMADGLMYAAKNQHRATGKVVVRAEAVTNIKGKVRKQTLPDNLRVAVIE
jgi:diguanylate cyclase (GGDEF)-like protein